LVGIKIIGNVVSSLTSKNMGKRSTIGLTCCSIDVFLWFQGTFQWSGTLSKKKGQKWGINSSNKKNADVGYHAGIAGSNTEVNNLVMDIKVTENGFCAVSNRRIDEGSNVEMSSVKAVANEEKSRGVPFDFESLYPLTQLPKVFCLF
jgi:coilin